MPVISALRRLKQEDHQGQSDLHGEFEASLDYIVRPSPHTHTKKKKIKNVYWAT
jgi:hypothetical protein